MTRPVRDRILKDANGNISDHLRNHIHLTNCIHLKNHMHKHSPMLSDRALMRDLVVLQRSKSLRDPSASPPSCSYGEKNARRSIGIERTRESGKITRTSPQASKKQVRDSVSGNSGSRDKKKGGNRQDFVAESDDDDDNEASSRNNESLRQMKLSQEAGASIRGHGNRPKRRKFRGSRKTCPSLPTRDADTQSVASNSIPRGRKTREFIDQNAPVNACGIHLNWSSIHHKGKSILDMAGRSISCGLSDPRLKKEGANEMTVLSSSSSTKSRGEVLPLLHNDKEAWIHDYSGELGIYADNLLKEGLDSDLASEGRSREHKFHQNLTQKYAPRTFKDLVGQNLVVKALSNAILKRMVGLLYVFYGAHGTGKTSCASIFARVLNCQSSDSSKPCGFCDSCIEGKSRKIWEAGPVNNLDAKGVIELLETMNSAQVQSRYKVFILDDCDSLSPECWGAILKVVDRAPRRVVFVLVCSTLDVLPHVIISRCQKFFFPKLRDSDIIYTLQWIAAKEEVEIDKDALKLIASRSDGSLRDAEMTLEQLSLLGGRISLSLVQELVGLISDEKLVDLLDLALSADTVNTVKNLRDIMESGVEPLALMSQLATVITDILAGSYDFTKGRNKRKFFRHQTLTKEDMEKLRQALKTLSEAEKQLRVSNDRMTWLTAALLQLAPDQQYMLPSSDTSVSHSPLVVNKPAFKERPRKSNVEMQVGSSGKGSVSQNASNDRIKIYKGKSRQETDEIWLEVLEKIPISSIREFMYREGKLVSLSYGAAPTVQLLFNSQPTKSKAEKLRSHILQAFESVLRSPVTIEIRCESRKDVGAGPILLPTSHDPSHLPLNLGLPLTIYDNARSALAGQNEIVELEASPREYMRKSENSFTDQRKLGDRNQSLSLVRSKVSLADVIQKAEASSQQSGWSQRKAVSIAEKLEQENLRLEPRSRRLLCWNPPRVSRRKLSRLKFRTRKAKSLLKFVSCGRCLSSRSPR